MQVATYSASLVSIATVFLIEKTLAENDVKITTTDELPVTTSDLETIQQQTVVNTNAKNISESFLYTVLVSLLVCLILMLCIISVGVYCRRLSRKKSKVQKVIYQVKIRSKQKQKESSKLLPEMDNHLNEKAEVYHYQQAKKNIKEFLRKNPPPPPYSRSRHPQDGATPLLLTEGETSDGEMSVYECSGIAAGVEENTEIRNPLFDDMTESQREKIGITSRAQVVREFGHTDLTAYGSINRTIPGYNR